MEDKINNLVALVKLYQSNAINKEEFNLLKNDLFSKRDSNVKPNNEGNNTSSTQLVSKGSTKTNPQNNKNYLFTYFFSIFIFLLIVAGLNSISEDKKSITPNTQTEVSSPIESPKTSTVESNWISCSICGRTFNGRGYEEVSEGQWIKCTDKQSFICSIECGLKHTRTMNNLIEKSVRQNGVSNGTRCKNCGLGHYVNGFCDMCGTASKEVVEEHNSRMPKCEICDGVGKLVNYRDNGNEYHICPSCNGTGHASF